MKIELILALLAFLLGSVPFGLLIAKAFGVGNLRESGSGNIGATNVSRVVGFWPAGFLTLLLDALKGMLFVLAFGQGWIAIEGVEITPTLLWFLGFCAVLGHCFSPWLRFNGGKGVATTYGVVLALAPWSGGLGILSYLLAFLSTRVGSVGSLFGLAVALSIHLLFYPFGTYFYFFVGIFLIVVFRHEKNLVALTEKRERSF